MKKLFYLFIISAFLGGCSKGDDSPDSPVDTKPTITLPSFQSDPVFVQEGGEVSYSFTSTADWNVSFDETRVASWLSISPLSGKAGDAVLNIKTIANDTYDERRATVTIKAGAATKSFVVSQKQKDALLTTTNRYDVDQEGGTISIEVKANVEFTATINDKCKDWITELESSRALSATTKMYKISRNEEADQREGSITFSNGALSETVKVYQAGGNIIMLTQKETVVSDKGEVVTVELKSNCDYEVVMPGVDWIKENTTRGLSSHTLYYAVAPNETYDSREAQIIFRDKQKDGRADTLNVVQVQKDAIIVAKNKYEVSCSETTLDFTVSTNVDFEVATDAEWIQPLPESRGLIEKPLNFAISTNYDQEPREGNIIISYGEMKQTVNVVQAGCSSPFIVKQKEYHLPVEGCHFAIQVTNPEKVSFDLSGLPKNCYQYDLVGKNSHFGVFFFSLGEISKEEKREGELIIKSTEGNYADTIKIFQEEVTEQLHGGSGNSNSFHSCITPCSNMSLTFPIHTNLETYERIIINPSDRDVINHISTEKADFGFNEVFRTSDNDTGKDMKATIAFIGKNICYFQGIIQRRQLFICFEEPEVVYVSKDGGSVTIHAYTEDDNLNIQLEGDDTSWLEVESVDDTYKDGVRRINTTYKVARNQSGKKREVAVVGYNGFQDKNHVTIVQESGESILLSDADQFAGGWKHDMEIVVSDENAIVKIDGDTPWITLGEAKKGQGILKQTLHLEKNETNAEREAKVSVANGSISNVVSVRQLPESGAMVDDSPEIWRSFIWKQFEFETPYPNNIGTKLYKAIVEDPQQLITVESRKVLSMLYFTPEDEHMPQRVKMQYVLDNFDGVSYCGGQQLIALSNQYVEKYYFQYGAIALVKENRGVLTHELTHAFQLEPKGCGDYGSSKVFHSFIEGIADCVRVLNGGFPNESDRPKGGHYLDSYRYTGFFLAWLVKNKDKDFLRKFNKSAKYVEGDWTFDKGIKYALGDSYNVDDLWNEYLKAMGDI